MRRTLWIVTCLLLGCCATTLHRQAELAEQTAILIDSAGAAIEREAADSWAAIDGSASPESVAARARLRRIFEPLVAAYNTLRAAQIAYKASLEAANDAGAAKASDAPLKALVAAWQEFSRQADVVGVKVPKIPKALLGGGP